jgi:hypothetical protein
MNRQPPARSRELSFDELEDAQDLRSVIATALAATPVDERSLRRGVWTFVGSERDLGTSPGHVIVALTELVEASSIAPSPMRQSVMRQVILWCVEAYFGHLGGQAVGTGADPRSMAPALLPRRASNR